MNSFAFTLLLVLLVLGPAGPGGAAESAGNGADAAVREEGFPEDAYFEDDWLAPQNEVVRIADPLEPVNRVFFEFNDRLYFWVLKPVGSAYGWVVPKPVRSKVVNFFYNLKTPVRLVNNVLQGKVMEGGIEMTRFMLNTTVGVGGLWDPARNWFNLPASEEDFGQTLGKYGVGEVIYFCWPVLGPSTVRDTLGFGGDYFLNPVSYLGMNGEADAGYGLKAAETINSTSLRIGDYEDFKKASFDPYGAMRDAYFQRRRSRIEDRDF